ncbi:acetate--CoA ligase family protein [Ensifer adhaerens]|uniref:acetate--CoA ligase family protein n=1 Tax=Ensifer adhaerens TaxID=106592 RepID=UPI001C4DE654|nr:acetate--CoA ligase family protein [Ensifer adhaerens]MBW0370819.1 acetate--CoA ligase family protein [Ensifer adhaerens]UCM24277.1 acetate--CoA ligase family protein [Ensifer adhaerens]
MKRDLTPLFSPSSVAIFGASGREGRPGYEIVKALKSFPGGPRIYPVTPSYQQIDEVRCYADFNDIPEKIDLGVIASGPARIVEDAASAISIGARALHVIGDLGAEDGDRLWVMAREAGALLLGPNSIGFVDFLGGVASTWAMPPENHRSPGSIALILQSGALFSYANSIDPRLKFSTTVHLGRELDVDVVDMIYRALSVEETRVIGIYLESVGDSKAFGEALSLAASRDVPVVVLAPGRTAEAAEAIATHAGRMAGGKAPLEAIIRRYRLIECISLDQFWCTLHLLSSGIRFDRGGVAIVTDSGAQRAMALDAASRVKLPLARFSKATEAALREVLAPELSPANPVDIWAGEKDVAGHVANCLSTVLSDDDTSVGVVVTEFGVPAADTFSTRIAEGVARLAGGAKPVLAIGFSTRHFVSDRIMGLERAGVPVLDGLETSFAALAHLHHYRASSSYPTPPGLSDSRRLQVESALAKLTPNDEATTLDLIEAAGISTVARATVESLEEAIKAAGAIGYPVVVKTAEAVAHKTEVGGVWLDVTDAGRLEEAYADLATRIGRRVLVASMVKGGVELALGAVIDPVAGPMVMVAAGGVKAELLADRQFALAPVSEDEALDMVQALNISPTLDPYRGKPGIDRHAIASAVASLSRLISEHSPTIAAVDINPIIATPHGVVAVDALVSLKAKPVDLCDDRQQETLLV